MKKLIVLFLALGLMVSGTALAWDAPKATLIDATLNETTTITSDGVKVERFERVSFGVTYDETEVGETLSATITLELSSDDITYLTGGLFYDLAGSTTLVTSEVISTDSSYIFTMWEGIRPRYVRVKVVGTSTDADDTIAITVKMNAQK